MRFDDRLSTLLAQRQESADARIALWRQLVDLLAQGQLTSQERLEDEAIETIAELRGTIPPDIKARTAGAFAGRPVNAAVIALYAEEPAPVLGPLISAARLDADQWLGLLPTLTPTARALLRHRRDLPKAVVRALDSFGPSDFVLPVGADDAGAREASAPDARVEAEVDVGSEVEAETPGTDPSEIRTEVPAETVADRKDVAAPMFRGPSRPLGRGWDLDSLRAVLGAHAGRASREAEDLPEDMEVAEVFPEDPAADWDIEAPAAIDDLEPVDAIDDDFDVAPAIAGFDEPEIAPYLPVDMFEPDGVSEVGPVPQDHLAHADGETQIRELLTRIEAFRSHDFIRPAVTMPVDEDLPQPRENDDGARFRFETGPDGVIGWVAPGGPNAAVGCSIAVAAIGASYGVDAQVVGAFRQRAPFRDARFTLGGASDHAGEWRISAVPMFDQVNGRFSGYRGTARRPRVDEVAVRTVGEGLIAGAETTDSLRQLVHELRTPLNAIIGFSEMIEGQYLGPASQRYRDKAGEISMQGRRLLQALEDLDLTTRVDRGGDAAPVDPVQLMERLHDQYQALAEERGFLLDFRVVTTLGEVAADPVAVERMIGRLLAATLAVARPGEAIRVSLDHDPEHRNRMLLSIARPSLLAGRDERTLLDPGYTPDEDLPEAPILGLGFALRLVRNIAGACGGTLDIGDEALVLRLPLRRNSARRGKG